MFFFQGSDPDQHPDPVNFNSDPKLLEHLFYIFFSPKTIYKVQAHKYIYTLSKRLQRQKLASEIDVVKENIELHIPAFYLLYVQEVVTHFI